MHRFGSKALAALLALSVAQGSAFAPAAHALFGWRWSTAKRKAADQMRPRLSAAYQDSPAYVASTEEGADAAPAYDLWRRMYAEFQEDLDRRFEFFKDDYRKSDFDDADDAAATFVEVHGDQFRFHQEAWMQAEEPAPPRGTAPGFELGLGPGLSPSELGFDPLFPNGVYWYSDRPTLSSSSEEEEEAPACSGEEGEGAAFGQGGSTAGCDEAAAPDPVAGEVAADESAAASETETATAPSVKWALVQDPAGTINMVPALAIFQNTLDGLEPILLRSGVAVWVPRYTLERVDSTLFLPSWEEGKPLFFRIANSFGSLISPYGLPNGDAEDRWVLRFSSGLNALRLPKSVVEVAEFHAQDGPARDAGEKPAISEEGVLILLEMVAVTGEAPAEGTTEVALGSTYRIQPGDTLSDIALRTRRLLGEGAPELYGPRGMIAALASVNGESIQDPDRIRAGDDLFIPPAEFFEAENLARVFAADPSTD